MPSSSYTEAGFLFPQQPYKAGIIISILQMKEPGLRGLTAHPRSQGPEVAESGMKHRLLPRQLSVLVLPSGTKVRDGIQAHATAHRPRSRGERSREATTGWERLGSWNHCLEVSCPGEPLNQFRGRCF